MFTDLFHKGLSLLIFLLQFPGLVEFGMLLRCLPARPLPRHLRVLEKPPPAGRQPRRLAKTPSLTPTLGIFALRAHTCVHPPHTHSPAAGGCRGACGRKR